MGHDGKPGKDRPALGIGRIIREKPAKDKEVLTLAGPDLAPVGMGGFGVGLGILVQLFILTESHFFQKRRQTMQCILNIRRRSLVAGNRRMQRRGCQC